MTAPRSDHLLRAFLEEGVDELPDRTYAAVRDDIHRTRQRGVFGPWRTPSMITFNRLAIGAAVIVAMGLVWTNLGPPLGGIGRPPTPGPTPTASPEPSPQRISGGIQPLQPGRYWFDYGAITGSSDWSGTSIHITVPATGWTTFGNFAVDRNYGTSDALAGASFVVWHITNINVDPCTDHSPAALPPGRGIDDLLEALAGQTGIDAGPLTDVTIDGYTGKFVELTVAVDITTCPGGFFPWVDKYVQGNDEVLRVYALDVEDRRLTFFARIPAMTTPEHRAELESIIDSVDIQP